MLPLDPSLKGKQTKLKREREATQQVPGKTFEFARPVSYVDTRRSFAIHLDIVMRVIIQVQSFIIKCLSFRRVSFVQG